MSYDYSTTNPADFQNSLSILRVLTQNEPDEKLQRNLFPNHGKQSPIQSALNILNKVAIEGTKEQKRELLSKNVFKQITDLNKMLKNHAAFSEKVQGAGFTQQDADSVQGYQIAKPQTKLGRLLAVATLIRRIVFVILVTLVTLVFAGIIGLPLDFACNLNPKKASTETVVQEKQSQAPYDGLQVAGVVCFNSPLRGTPILDRFFNKETRAERYKNMSHENEWRHKLYTDSLQAERDRELNVYTYGSTLDPVCENNCHFLTENPTKTVTVGTEGHLDTMISYRAMKFLRKAVREIDPSGQVPVVQLHGSSAGKFQFAIFRLASGHKRTFTVDYAESKFSNDPKTAIPTYAQNEKIKALFKEVHRVTGQKRVILVGHSMGGLVSLDIARTVRNHRSA